MFQNAKVIVFWFCMCACVCSIICLFIIRKAYKDICKGKMEVLSIEEKH